MCYECFPLCWPFACCLKTAEIPSGSIRAMEDGRGNFEWLGNAGPYSGIHQYWSWFYRITRETYNINEATEAGGRVIQNGTQWIVIVPQV